MSEQHVNCCLHRNFEICNPVCLSQGVHTRLKYAYLYRTPTCFSFSCYVILLVTAVHAVMFFLILLPFSVIFCQLQELILQTVVIHFFIAMSVIFGVFYWWISISCIMIDERQKPGAGQNVSGTIKSLELSGQSFSLLTILPLFWKSGR